MGSALVFISYLSIFCTLAIGLVLIYFSFKYKRKTSNDITPNYRHNTFLETVWTIIPTVLVFLIFFIALFPYLETERTEGYLREVNVKAQKWTWTFKYTNGKETFNELYLKVNEPVRIVITADDVLHSFFVPAFRLKKDAVPNMYTFTTFTPTKTGDYVLYCAEYCGLAHSDMKGIVHVLNEQDFIAWESASDKLNKEGKIATESGNSLYLERGCNACHSVDGKNGAGPTWKGLYGQDRDLADGSSLNADENYLKESILYPKEKIAKGYGPIMPSYKGLLSNEEITEIINYIKELK